MNNYTNQLLCLSLDVIGFGAGIILVLIHIYLELKRSNDLQEKKDA